MASKLVLGQPVEVNIILASGGAFQPLTHVWSAGYVFHGFRGDLAVVKQVKPGLFSGCLINYAQEGVRSAKVQL